MIEWVIELAIRYFSHCSRERNEIWYKGGECGWCPNFEYTHSAEKARDTTLETMKNNRNIIQCCNNTRQGAPRSGKQTSTCASDLVDGSHVTCPTKLFLYVCTHSRINPLKPIVITRLHFNCLVPCRPNPPFLISDIRALWRSTLSTRVPECQKLKMVGYACMAKCLIVWGVGP